MSQAQSSIFPSVDEAKAESGQFFPPKVFAQPFRLAFNRPADPKDPGARPQTVWIEVRSLEGLRKVSNMLQKGELLQIDPFSSMEMQLWGLLAEHCGFMRIQGNVSTLAAGIQPLGSGIAPLAEDLASIMGGNDETALRALDAMQTTLSSRPCSDGPMVQPPLTHEFVKPDGVNLTEQGEDTLRDLVFGPPNANYPDRKSSPEAKAFHKDSENAVEIFLHQTPNATPEEVEAEIKEAIDCSIAAEHGTSEGEIVVGPEAARIGRLVADVGRGLDNEEDKAVQDEAKAAMEILQRMVAMDKPSLAQLQEEAKGLLDRYGVSMEELKALADRAKKVSDERAKPKEPRDPSTVSEVEWAAFVEASEPQETEERPLTDGLGPDGPCTTYEAPNPEDPYKSDEDSSV